MYHLKTYDNSERCIQAIADIELTNSKFVNNNDYNVFAIYR